MTGNRGIIGRAGGLGLLAGLALCVWPVAPAAGDFVPVHTTATLSVARAELAATTVDGKALFGGGVGGIWWDRVDIYDSTTGLWSTASLSQPRGYLTATSVGDLAFFAGGQTTGAYSNVVDIYNAATGAWSTTTLSHARRQLAAASAGGKALFGGGAGMWGKVVDIYDTATGIWTTATLAQGGERLSAVSVGGKVFFAGGDRGTNDVVDIYDTAANSWSTAKLSQPRFALAAAAAGGKVFFGGGTTNGGGLDSDLVDICDTATETWSTARLSQARWRLTAASAGGKVFFGGGEYLGSFDSDVVDIYDTMSGLWTTSALSKGRFDFSATSVGNEVLFGGGGTWGASVDIYTVPEPATIFLLGLGTLGLGFLRKGRRVCRGTRRTRRKAGKNHCLPALEVLEPRLLLSEVPLVTPGPGGVEPFAGLNWTVDPSGLMASQIRRAYGIKALFDDSQLDGSGQTMAIVVPYDAPGMPTTWDGSFPPPPTDLLAWGNDLARFDYREEITPGPQFSFQKAGHIFNTESYVAPPTGDPKHWVFEASMDVEWAHAGKIGKIGKIGTVTYYFGSLCGR